MAGSGARLRPAGVCGDRGHRHDLDCPESSMRCAIARGPPSQAHCREQMDTSAFTGQPTLLHLLSLYLTGKEIVCQNVTKLYSCEVSPRPSRQKAYLSCRGTYLQACPIVSHHHALSSEAQKSIAASLSGNSSKAFVSCNTFHP